MRKKIIIGAAVFFALTAALGQASGNEPVSLEEVLRRSSASYAKVKDYTCILHRKDVVNGSLKEHSDVIFKFMKPLRFYMKWPVRGIEAIYAEGKYDNEMKIHGELLYKNFNVGVSLETALKYSRHTIREADIGHILDIMHTNYRKGAADKDAAFVLDADERLDARETWRFKATLPPDKDYYGHVIFLNIDKELYLPVKLVVYGWDMELLEQYYYEDMKVNVGLTEEDFDVNNADYSFK